MWECNFLLERLIFIDFAESSQIELVSLCFIWVNTTYFYRRLGNDPLPVEQLLFSRGVTHFVLLVAAFISDAIKRHAERRSSICYLVYI